MGFGLCALGYLMFMVDAVGGGVVGCLLMAAGFFRLSKIDNKFIASAVLSLMYMFYSVINVLSIIGIIDSNGTLYSGAYIYSLIIGLALHATFTLIIRKIAISGGADKLARKAVNSLSMASIYYLWAIIEIIVKLPGMDIIIGIYRYVVYVIVLVFLYDCYAKITTKSQADKDVERLKKIDKKLEEKKLKKEERRKTEDENQDLET